jgi:carboxypeptidase family protein
VSVVAWLARLRSSMSLGLFRTIVLLLAASFSIAGYVHRYLEIATAPTEGELLTVVRDAGGAPLSDARIAVLTLANEPVTSFRAVAPAGGPRVLREGTYRLRVTHPKYVTETRMVQVTAGHTSEVRIKLGPRTVRAAHAPTQATTATRAGDERPDGWKRIFKR